MWRQFWSAKPRNSIKTKSRPGLVPEKLKLFHNRELHQRALLVSGAQILPMCKRLISRNLWVLNKYWLNFEKQLVHYLRGKLYRRPQQLHQTDLVFHRWAILLGTDANFQEESESVPLEELSHFHWWALSDISEESGDFLSFCHFYSVAERVGCW